mmetsp:Transcript_9808/g.25471  ORF Transcript_9808/g.25471 Transcript_9808/m.25471 type:complete len:539 (-) Transcript_9808:64-1680(-)
MSDKEGSGGKGGGKKNKYGTYSSEEAQKKKKQRDKSKEILDTLFTTVCALHPTARSHDPQKHQGRFNSALLDAIDLIKMYKETRPIAKPAPQASIGTNFTNGEIRASLLASSTFGVIHVCVDDWRVSHASKAISSYCPFMKLTQYVGQNLQCLTHIDDHVHLEELKRQALAFLSPAATPPQMWAMPLRLLRLCRDERAGLLLGCFSEQVVHVLHVGREATTGRSQVLLGFAPSKADLEPMSVSDTFWNEWDSRAGECLGVCRVTRVEPKTGLVDLRAWTASRGMSGVQTAAGQLFSSMAESLGEWTQSTIRESANEIIKRNAVYHWYLQRARGGIMRVQVCCRMSIAGLMESDWVPAVTYDVGTAAMKKAGKPIGRVGELHQFAAVLLGDPKRADAGSSMGLLSMYMLQSQQTGLGHTQMYLAHVFKVPDQASNPPHLNEPLSPTASEASLHSISTSLHSIPGSPIPISNPRGSRNATPLPPVHDQSHRTTPHILTHLSCAGLKPIKLFYTRTGPPDQELIEKHFWTAEGIRFPWAVD